MILDYIKIASFVLGIIILLYALYYLFRHNVFELMSGINAFERSRETYSNDNGRRVFESLSNKDIRRSGDTGKISLLGDSRIKPSYTEITDRPNQEPDWTTNEPDDVVDEEKTSLLNEADEEKTLFLSDNDEEKTSFLDEKTSLVSEDEEKTEYLADDEEENTVFL